METITISKTITNVDVVRSGYAAFNSADMNALNQIFHDNSSWHTPGKSSIGGYRKGKENVFAQFGRYGGETNGTFKATLKNLAICDDGRIVGVHRNSGERNGKKLEVDCCIVFEVKDEQIISGKEYFFDLNAWDEFWS
ncbi:MAG: nuclear transport factor 2 family protein [Chitinophagaceae bacterium]